MRTKTGDTDSDSAIECFRTPALPPRTPIMQRRRTPAKMSLTRRRLCWAASSSSTVAGADDALAPALLDKELDGYVCDSDDSTDMRRRRSSDNSSTHALADAMRAVGVALLNSDNKLVYAIIVVLSVIILILLFYTR
jgi:hypothetical protein